MTSSSKCAALSKLDLNKNHSSAEPPSYDSLFGRIRDTHKASRNVIDFVVKVRISWRNFRGQFLRNRCCQKKTTALEKMDLVRDGVWERNQHTGILLKETEGRGWGVGGYSFHRNQCSMSIQIPLPNSSVRDSLFKNVTLHLS